MNNTTMAFSWNSEEVPDVRYAIIGNGFDLECGLQTSYGSFLSFVREEKYLSAFSDAILVNPVDWQNLRNHNYWFARFEDVHIGSGWVDFENEIARVVISIERCMTSADGNRSFIDDDLRWNVLCDSSPVLAETYCILSEKDGDVQTFRDLVKRLLDDLGMFTRCFESYLYNYASKNPRETGVTKGLVKLLGECDFAYVISFNYTKTLENMLKSSRIDAEFCYVHGIIGNGSSKNAMVLGIDEHLDPSEVGEFIEFGPFRKYNQRIYKRTDSSYMSWLEEDRYPYKRISQLDEWEERFLLSSSHASVDIKQTQQNIGKLKAEYENMIRKREVIILGHSLGITDKDILKPFIIQPDTRTVVYYHSEDSFSKQVSNMTGILGMDEVITRAGAKERTLEFRSQKELV